ncbi:MAG: hypothetical protein NTV36_02535 [Candidatus Staskawiczbacteria bacterium]|nr:hypothetical protein [Candidatus Staskawiczbacteria bacterium]
MPFQVDNGRAVKSVHPEIDFPIKQNGETVAVLILPIDDQDSIRLEILKPGQIAVRVNGSQKLFDGDVTVKRKSFEIHSQQTDNAILVKFIADH